MSSRAQQHDIDDYIATPAPHVEEVTVDRLATVEPATAPAVTPVEAATVDPAVSVEPATLYQTTTTTLQYEATRHKATDLPAKVVRGATGADLESAAAVLHGAAHKNILQILLPCLYDERDFVAYGEVKKYILVKDGLCYVYIAETDPKPLYAIELHSLFAVLEDRARPEKGSVTISPMPNTNLPRETMKTILLKSRRTGKQVYQFTFDTEHDPTLAQVFLDLVNNNASKKAKNDQGVAGPTKTTFGKNEKC